MTTNHTTDETTVPAWLNPNLVRPDFQAEAERVAAEISRHFDEMKPALRTAGLLIRELEGLLHGAPDGVYDHCYGAFSAGLATLLSDINCAVGGDGCDYAFPHAEDEDEDRAA